MCPREDGKTMTIVTALMMASPAHAISCPFAAPSSEASDGFSASLGDAASAFASASSSDLVLVSGIVIAEGRKRLAGSDLSGEDFKAPRAPPLAPRRSSRRLAPHAVSCDGRGGLRR